MKRQTESLMRDRVASLPRDIDWAQVAEGTRAATVAALAARDRLDAATREGDPRYPVWWSDVARAAAQLAHHARLVQVGLESGTRARSVATHTTPRTPVPGVPITIRRCSTVRRR